MVFPWAPHQGRGQGRVPAPPRRVYRPAPQQLAGGAGGRQDPCCVLGERASVQARGPGPTTEDVGASGPTLPRDERLLRRQDPELRLLTPAGAHVPRRAHGQGRACLGLCATCHLSSVICHLSSIHHLSPVIYPSSVIYCLSPVLCSSPVTCHLPPVIYLSPVICHLLVICHLCIIYHLPPVIRGSCITHHLSSVISLSCITFLSSVPHQPAGCACTHR